jgi:hypothetical protein
VARQPSQQSCVLALSHAIRFSVRPPQRGQPTGQSSLSSSIRRFSSLAAARLQTRQTGAD